MVVVVVVVITIMAVEEQEEKEEDSGGNYSPNIRQLRRKTKTKIKIGTLMGYLQISLYN